MSGMVAEVGASGAPRQPTTTGGGEIVDLTRTPQLSSNKKVTQWIKGINDDATIGANGGAASTAKPETNGASTGVGA